MPLRAFGADTKGTPFRQVVCTLDLSTHGARIMGLQGVELGQELTLEYKSNKVRFKVVWIGDPGGPHSGQVGLRIMEDKQLADLDELLKGEYVDTWGTERSA